MNWVGAGLCAVAAASGAEAPAPPGLHLSWVRTAAASTCVDATRVESDVERRLGWSPFVTHAGPTAAVEVVVTREQGAWRASIVMRRPDGETLGSRDVESDAANCDSLARASALAIALMIQTAYTDLDGGTALTSDASTKAAADVASTSPDVATRVSTEAPPAPSPAPPPELPAAAASRAVVDGIGGAPARREGALGVELIAGMSCAGGLLPGLACGPTLKSELSLFSPFALTVGLSFLPEQALERAGSSVAFGLTFASVGACHRLGLGEDWSVSSCASLLAGALHVTVEDPTPVAPGERWWWAAAGGLRLGWHPGVLSLSVGVDAVAPLARRDYTLVGVEPDQTSSLFVEASLGAIGLVGAGVDF